MNTIHGLTRTPYYPELAVFNRNEADICALVLSVLLYWHSLDEHQRFNSRKHQDQLARNLRVDTARVFDVLEYLTKLRILRLKTQCHETLTGKNKEDRFYTLDFHELSQKLQAQVQRLQAVAQKQAQEQELLFPPRIRHFQQRRSRLPSNRV